jgi:hypothetical protein
MGKSPPIGCAPYRDDEEQVCAARWQIVMHAAERAAMPTPNQYLDSEVSEPPIHI